MKTYEKKAITYEGNAFRKTFLDNDEGKKINPGEIILRNADLSGCDLSGMNFRNSDFDGVNLEGANFTGCCLHKVWFKDCNMKGVKFINTDLTEATLRYENLTGADFSGANLHCALLEYTVLDDVKYNEKTKFFKMRCPEEGAFIAWKCCTELRVVQLLIPADAKRVSATAETCRCDKAKVLSIKNIDETISYEWAQSTVDPDFYYEKGKWVYPHNGFEESRWRDSSEGIHFFMKRQEAIDYQTK